MLKTKIAELRGRAETYLATARKILDAAEAEHRDLKPAEDADYRGLLAKADSINKTLALHHDLSAAVADLARPLSGEDREGTLLSDPGGYTATDTTGREIRLLTREQRFADLPSPSLIDGINARDLSFGRWLRGKVTGNWHGAEAEQRVAQGSSDAVYGGYLVPDVMWRRIIDLARNNTAVLRAGALSFPMEASEVHLAKVTGDPTAVWKAENVAVPESTMTFGTLLLSAKTLACLVKCSLELIQDAVNLDQVVTSAMSQGLALEMDRVSLRGIGAGAGSGQEPLGIRNNSGIQTIDKASATLTKYDDFVNAVGKLALKNATGPYSAIYNPVIGTFLELLKDTTNQVLLPPPSFVELAKFQTNQVPANLGTGSDETEVYIGDFRQLVIGIRRELVVNVSEQAGDSSGSAFTQGQLWIRVFMRADVGLLRPDHHCVIINCKKA